MLRVLVADFVQRIGCPIAFTNHVRAIGVILRRSGLGSVFRFHEGNEIVLEKIRQRGRGLLLTDAHQAICKGGPVRGFDVACLAIIPLFRGFADHLAVPHEFVPVGFSALVDRHLLFS